MTTPEISREATDSSGTTEFPVPDAGHNLRGKPADPADDLTPVEFHDHDDHASSGHDHYPYAVGAPMVFDPEPVVTGPTYYKRVDNGAEVEYSRFTVQTVSGYWQYEHRTWGDWDMPEPQLIVEAASFQRLGGQGYAPHRPYWHSASNRTRPDGKTETTRVLDVPHAITEATLVVSQTGLVPWCMKLTGMPAPAPEPEPEA